MAEGLIRTIQEGPVPMFACSHAGSKPAMLLGRAGYHCTRCGAFQRDSREGWELPRIAPTPVSSETYGILVQSERLDQLEQRVQDLRPILWTALVVATLALALGAVAVF